MDASPFAWHIYTLADPRDGEIRYVGWSSNPRQRLNAHISCARHGGTHNRHWIAQLISLSLRPILVIVESGNDNWRDAERRWIAYYRAQGCRLNNLTDGGDGTPGHIPSPETRAKMRAAQLGRKQTPESTAKTAAALRGRKHSAEHKANAAAARKGRIPTAATEAAASFWRGRKQSPEHIAKRIAPLIGKPRVSQRLLTPEAVMWIRASRGNVSQRTLASAYGVSASTIHAIQNGHHYSDLPL